MSGTPPERIDIARRTTVRQSGFCKTTFYLFFFITIIVIIIINKRVRSDRARRYSGVEAARVFGQKIIIYTAVEARKSILSTCARAVSSPPPPPPRHLRRPRGRSVNTTVILTENPDFRRVTNTSPSRPRAPLAGRLPAFRDRSFAKTSAGFSPRTDAAFSRENASRELRRRRLRSRRYPTPRSAAKVCKKQQAG